MGHSEPFCAHEGGESATVVRGWGLDLRAPVRRATRTGGERWLNEEGLSDGGGEANMKSEESTNLHGNSMNGGSNMEASPSSNLRGKHAMIVAINGPDFKGEESRSTLQFNEIQLGLRDVTYGPIGPEEKKRKRLGLEVGRASISSELMRTNLVFVAEENQASADQQKNFLGVSLGIQARPEP